ncbi:carotenoid oxygenase family protein [Amycolatopsis acidiphila]|uniref:Dioxygenase n=1 Tax=Amycolatopsis acidiphila TaxID=715473 RepID=A0A558AG66_9PSEU|nr:carotenoid oxygenase family protein [Amycolatopsis acidiphila]TVT23262.1 carotenoid oxygenase family protein [Amycolatopsis acidiphila]UIJ56480.1 carotenoid oxygenase family protein [Amycolatopsis acidiphila]GHG67025.1 carotenoid oxygenase [Amycolatopsis acidiphila]
MTTRFPQDPMFAGFSAPVRVEADIYDLEVAQGEVPGQLDGTYYRVVCDRQWPPMVAGDIPFNADGMVMSFRFERGHVDFKSRYVRTPRFEAERKARRSLFGAYRNPFTDDPSVAGMNRTLANTNVFWHGGKLLASKEDSPPIQIDPDTLDTVGVHTFDGALTSQTSTAHPKFDPRTGEMVFFGFAAKGECTPDIAFYEADRDGNLVHETWFQAPYSSMVHDFAVTQNFVVFPIIPLVSDLGRIRAGLSHYAWDPGRDVHLGVLPRKGRVEDLRWYRGGTRFASHILGAYDDGRHIHIDTPVSESNYFPFFPDLSGAPADPGKTKGYLSRWTIDTMGERGSFTQERLTTHAGEFPRMDDRFETLPYSWGVMGMYEVPGEPRPGRGFRWVGAVDLEHRRTTTHYVGDCSSVGEPLFVPAHEKAGHAEGYVLAVVGRHDEMRSDLLILDAGRIDAPPVATVKLPIRVPYGLHGNWVTRGELQRG